MFEVMARNVDRRIAKVKIDPPIPDRVHQRRFVKDLDFFGQALRRFRVPEGKSVEDLHGHL